MVKEWQALKPVSKVRIIAPAGVSKDPWGDLEKCCEFLQSWGLEPVVDKYKIFGNYDSFYEFANTPDLRYADFIDALQSDADAIWCYRGGYGSRELIELLVKNNVEPPAQPKLLIGFSDITDIHSYFNRMWNWPTLHAPVLRQLALHLVDSDTTALVKKIIFGLVPELQLSLIPLNTAAQQPQKLSAVICGGNLTTWHTAIGTSWEMLCADKIILIEDVGEVPYRIDRILQQLLNNQFFYQAKAIVLGDFLYDEKASSIPDKMAMVIKKFADKCPIPVLQRVGIGHGQENYPIPFNTATQLILGEQPQLVVSYGFRQKVIYPHPNPLPL